MTPDPRERETMTRPLTIARGPGVHVLPDQLTNAEAAQIIVESCRGRLWTPAECRDLLHVIAVTCDPPLPEIPTTGPLAIAGASQPAEFRSHALERTFPNSLAAACALDDALTAQEAEVESELLERVGAAIRERADGAREQAERHTRDAALLTRLGHDVAQGRLS